MCVCERERETDDAVICYVALQRRRSAKVYNNLCVPSERARVWCGVYACLSVCLYVRVGMGYTCVCCVCVCREHRLARVFSYKCSLSAHTCLCCHVCCPVCGTVWYSWCCSVWHECTHMRSRGQGKLESRPTVTRLSLGCLILVRSLI